MFFISNDSARLWAKKIRKALFRQGHEVSHGHVLDALSAAAGYRDWNSMSAAHSLAAVDRGLHDFEHAHIEGSQGDEYGDEVALVAHTGYQLRYGQDGDLLEYVRVCDPFGRELMFWHYDEWAQDPQVVMGAILGALVRGKPQPVEVGESFRAQERDVPEISELDFFEVHAVVINGQSFNLEWREESALAWLGRYDSPEYPDHEDETALTLHYEEDGLVFDETVSVGTLASLEWSDAEEAFVSKLNGDSYRFFLSREFGRTPRQKR